MHKSQCVGIRRQMRPQQWARRRHNLRTTQPFQIYGVESSFRLPDKSRRLGAGAQTMAPKADQVPSSAVGEAGVSSSLSRCMWAMKYRMCALSTVRWAADFQAS